jgi:murein DD-endopeptidase MepM/ murein hydrolase activator NlpD
LTITGAGRLFFSALALSSILFSAKAQAQTAQPSTQKPQSTSQVLSRPEPARQEPARASGPVSRPRTVTIVSDRAIEVQAEQANSQSELEKAERPRTVTVAKPAAAPAVVEEPVQNESPVQSVVPPAPNVIKRNPNAISIPAANAKDDGDYESQPVSSVSVGSKFGVRRDPFTRRRKFHSGVDIKAKWGDPVGASYPGTVSFVGWYHGYGNLVIVDHGGGIATHYAHLSSFEVEVGDHVERASVLGRAGSTGRATSPHLHYEVRVDGNAVNPFRALVLEPDSAYFKQSRPASQQAGTESPARPEDKPAPVETRAKQN